MSRTHVVFGCAILIASLGAGAGCSNSTGGSACTADKDCPAGSRCQAGSCQAFLTVDITRPALSPTSLCGTLHVEISVADGAATAVELRANDRVLATLAKPFTYDWDTTKETEGSYQLVARVPAGSQHYDSPGKTVVVDCTAPAAPLIGPLTTPTNLASIPVSGVAEVGATVRVYEGSNLLGQAVASASGAWTVGVSLAEGTRSLFATATDAAGNASGPSAAAAVVVDRTPPATPTLSATSPTRANPVAVAGTSEPGAEVRLFDGATPVGIEALVQGDGSWSAQIPLAEGSHQLTARATDAAGNASEASAAVPLIVDRTAPPAPSLTAPSSTRVSPVLISGTAEAGAIVRLYDAGVRVGADIAAAGGTWSASLDLAEGTHPLTATATDAAGNTSPTSLATSVVMDRTLPAAPQISPIASPTNLASIPVGGTAEVGTAIRIYEGGNLLGQATTSAAGAWTVSVSLAEGTHALTATATDGAGNTSAASAAISVVVDRTPPASPTLSAASPTRADPVAVGGSAEPGAKVQVFEGASPVGSAAIAQGNGTWSAQLPLAEGSHPLTAMATDAAGNASGASAAVTVVVDRTAPAAPSLTATTPTRASPVPVGGTAEAGATVRLYDAGVRVGSDVAAAAGGTWSASLTLAEGTHPLTATATDAAGNTSAASAATSVVVDRTAPAAPVVNAAALTCCQNPVVVRGTAEPGSKVHLLQAGAPAAPDMTAAADGSWSASLALAEGSYSFTATATDAAGNTSLASAASVAVVDRTAPTVLSTIPQSKATNVWSRDPIVLAFSEPILLSSVTAQSVVVQVGTFTVLFSASALSDGGRTLTLTPDPAWLPPVPGTATATVSGLTDLAGNPLAPAAFSWDLPEWQDLGTAWSSSSKVSLTSFSLAQSPSGAPAVAATANGVNPSFGSARYTGSGWQALPNPSGWSYQSVSGSIAMLAGNLPVLSWRDSSNGIQVARFDGAAWSSPETLDVSLTRTSASPSTGADETGTPFVAWVETPGSVAQVFARRWTGSAWSQLGGALSSTVPAASPIASVGATRVTWTETDATPTTTLKSSGFAGGAWGSGALTAALTPALVSGSPAASAAGVGFLLAPGTAVQAYRWNIGSISPPIPAHWEQLGTDLNPAASTGQAMALGPTGLPIVAWFEATGGYVSRWDAAKGWLSLTASPLTGRFVAGSLRVSVGPSGIIVVGFDDQPSLSHTLHVLRYNR